MEAELPSRLLLNRGLSSSTCRLFFLLTLYFEKINHLTVQKNRRTTVRDQKAVCRTSRFFSQWRKCLLGQINSTTASLWFSLFCVISTKYVPHHPLRLKFLLEHVNHDRNMGNKNKDDCELQEVLSSRNNSLLRLTW